MKQRKTFVTGIGCISAAGNSVDESMRFLYEGKRNPSPSQIFNSSIDTNYPVFEVKADLDKLTASFSQKILGIKSLSRTNKLLLIAVDEACKQSQLNFDSFDDIRIGTAIGTTVGCTLNNEQFYKDFRNEKYPDIAPLNAFLNNNPSLFISNFFKLNGPSICIANACSSGTDAIGIAKSWIESEMCDIVICGGADELCRVTYLGFISLMVTSSEPCTPFDKNRKGLNLGEGSGILILESEDSVKRRGVTPLAELIGYASRADAYHPTGPHPFGKGLRGAIYKAFGQAKLKPQDVNFINAHGTATIDNDKIEGKVIKDIFPHSIPVVSTKSYTGHTLGAAGGIEAVFTIKALIDKKLPATAGFIASDPEINLTPTTQNISIDAEIGLSNSLAFGGTNSVLIFRR